MKSAAPTTLRVLLVACCLMMYCTTSHCEGASPHKIFSGFTEPIHLIKVGVAEGGAVASVSVKRGAVVRQGDLLLSLDTAVLDANRRVAEAKSKTTARVDALEIESDVRQRRYEKLNRLYEDGAGSIEEVKRAKADAAVAELEVVAAREEMELRKLELNEIQQRIGCRNVRSPIDGVVTDVVPKAGEYVSLQDPHVATVVQLDQLRVTLFVPTLVAVELKTDAKLSLSLPETGQRCIGKVEYVGLVTEADSGRVRLDVLIENTERRFRSGVRCQWHSTASSAQVSSTSAELRGFSR